MSTPNDTSSRSSWASDDTSTAAGGDIPATGTPAVDLANAQEDLVAANEIAWRWHGDQTRKGRPTSYMSHLLAVEGLVIECGGTANQAIAALLHDSLEDAPNTEERIQRESTLSELFDPEVLQIILDCTDTRPDETLSAKRPWRERKERYLEQLTAASWESLLVAACDKRHNLGDLVRDLRAEGPETLQRFNAGASEQLWYFESVLRICRPSIPERLTQELEELLGAFRSLATPDERITPGA